MLNTTMLLLYSEISLGEPWCQKKIQKVKKKPDTLLEIDFLKLFGHLRIEVSCWGFLVGSVEKELSVVVFPRRN